jgi:hypothetical protein
MSTKFKVEDIVQHVVSGELCIITRVLLGQCLNPTHIRCYGTSDDPSTCLREPVDIYDVSTGLGADIMGVPGFLLRPAIRGTLTGVVNTADNTGAPYTPYPGSTGAPGTWGGAPGTWGSVP